MNDEDTIKEVPPSSPSRSQEKMDDQYAIKEIAPSSPSSRSHEKMKDQDSTKELPSFTLSPPVDDQDAITEILSSSISYLQDKTNYQAPPKKTQPSSTSASAPGEAGERIYGNFVEIIGIPMDPIPTDKISRGYEDGRYVNVLTSADDELALNTLKPSKYRRAWLKTQQGFDSLRARFNKEKTTKDKDKPEEKGKNPEKKDKKTDKKE
jgi:hypothetical protein